MTGLCTVPGCTNPRHVSKHGRIDSRCDMHFREKNKKVAHKKHVAASSTPTVVPDSVPARHVDIPAPETVRVMVLDWESQRLFHVTGRVDCTEQFPETEGDMKKVIAQAAQRGIYVAYIRAYKSEDLHESA